MFAALGLFSGLQRFAVTAGLVIALGGGLAVWVKARELRAVHAAITQRDALWSQKLLEQRQQAQTDRDALQAKVDQKAAVERAVAVADVLAAVSRAQALETDLATSKIDPIVFPRKIARDLRQ